MTYYDKNALKLSHEYLKAHINKTDVCVDATMGRGRDTLLLCNLSKEVYALDIQPDAIASRYTMPRPSLTLGITKNWVCAISESTS